MSAGKGSGSRPLRVIGAIHAATGPPWKCDQRETSGSCSRKKRPRRIKRYLDAGTSTLRDSQTGHRLRYCDRFTFGGARAANLRLRSFNRLAGCAPEVADEPNSGEQPDDPFRRIPLPRFYAVAIIVLKFVVIVVIAFPESEQCHQK